jgi:hypothetical protein
MQNIELSKDYELVRFAWNPGDSIVNVTHFDRTKGIAAQSRQTLSVEIARACWSDFMKRGFARGELRIGAG